MIVFIGGHENTGTRLVVEILCKVGFQMVGRCNATKDYMGSRFHKSFFSQYYKHKNNINILIDQIKKDTQNSKLSVIKHGHLMLLIPELKKHFQGSIFITCIRNTFDQLVKPSHNYQKYGGFDTWNPSIEEKFNFYKNWNDIGIKNADYIIKLEDLLYNKLLTITNLFNYLNIKNEINSKILNIIGPPSKNVKKGIKYFSQNKEKHKEIIKYAEEIGYKL